MAFERVCVAGDLDEAFAVIIPLKGALLLIVNDDRGTFAARMAMNLGRHDYNLSSRLIRIAIQRLK